MWGLNPKIKSHMFYQPNQPGAPKWFAVFKHVSWGGTFCIWLLSLCIMFLRFSMLQHVSVFHSFLLLSNKYLLYRDVRLCLSLHQLMDIWIAASAGLLWVIRLWTFRYESFCGYIFSFPPRKRVAGSFDNCAVLFNFLKDYQIVFQGDHTIW